jgi:putative colanic acid biosynthesis glycosyltransferase
MHILQIDVAVNVGSTGRIAEQIGQKVIENQWESTIAFGRQQAESQSQKIKIGNKWEQGYHLLLTRFFDRHGFGSVSGTKALADKIKFLSPDIIHLHQIHGYYINIQILFEFLSRYNKPVIWTLHDCWAYTGHCCYYERVNCNKWQTECNTCPLTGYYPQSWFMDNSKENYIQKKKLCSEIKDLTIVPVSNWLASELSHSFLKERPVIPICNGIDVHKFRYTDPSEIKDKLSLGDKKILLGVASPWSEVKGLNDFIRLSEIIDDNYKIILIGLSETQKKNLPNRIIGIGRLSSPSELVKYYSLADVFVNPSIAESFGLVTVEAMACGTPVVGYNVTATPELIPSGTGYVVDKGDVNALFQKVKIIVENGKNKYSEACRNNVVVHYNKDFQYEKYISLYRDKLH